MNVSYHCPQCQHAVRVDLSPEDAEWACPACRQIVRLPDDAFAAGQLRRCVACPSQDLFLRKDFPQRLGVSIVAIGIVGSSVAWAYSRPVLTLGVLMATALVDVVLYWLVPNALMCYRCDAVYRWAPGMERFGPFELETHERHRQQIARLSSRQS